MYICRFDIHISSTFKAIYTYVCIQPSYAAQGAHWDLCMVLLNNLIECTYIYTDYTYICIYMRSTYIRSGIMCIYT